MAHHSPKCPLKVDVFASGRLPLGNSKHNSYHSLALLPASNVPILQAYAALEQLAVTRRLPAGRSIVSGLNGCRVFKNKRTLFRVPFTLLLIHLIIITSCPVLMSWTCLQEAPTWSTISSVCGSCCTHPGTLAYSCLASLSDTEMHAQWRTCWQHGSQTRPAQHLPSARHIQIFQTNR